MDETISFKEFASVKDGILMSKAEFQAAVTAALGTPPKKEDTERIWKSRHFPDGICEEEYTCFMFSVSVSPGIPRRTGSGVTFTAPEAFAALSGGRDSVSLSTVLELARHQGIDDDDTLTKLQERLNELDTDRDGRIDLYDFTALFGK